MEVKLTDEQQEAVFACVSENLVSAAAGSGKTKVLSERIVKRLTSGDTSIDRLLIVTFTRAAASQMREKITSALEKENRINPSARIKRQLSLISGADICTIDSFCIDLVRRNFFRVGVPSDFTVADSNEMAILREEILIEVLEEMYLESDAGFLKLSHCAGKGKNDSALKEMITRVYDFTRAFEDPDKWLDEAVEAHRAGSEKNNALYFVLKKEIEDGISELGIILKKARDTALSLGVESYVSVFESEILSLNRNLSDIDAALAGGIEDFEFGSFVGKKVPSELAEAKELVKSMHDEAKDFYSVILKLYDVYKSERGLSFEKIAALSRCVKLFGEKYMAEKIARKELEFCDCEYYAMKVLNESEEATDELRKKYDEIYIDEYQDTNPLQDTLFTKISRKAWGEANLFIVGDIKQSIYRFRHSDPTLFANKAKTFGADEKSRKMILSKNFRSRREVLDSVNCVFENIMRENTAEIDYNEEHKLKCGASYVEYNKNKTELFVIDTKNLEEDELRKEQRETLLVADKIKKMMDTGFMVSDNGAMRKMRYSDVAVLSSAISGKADMIVNVFSLMNIPVRCEASKNFFDTLEIRTIIALLKAVDNPLCDIELASCMRSPIFSFDENELVEIRMKGIKEAFYENVCKKAEEESDLGEKCRQFTRTLEAWREMSLVMNVERFVSRIIDESGYYSFVGALPGGDVRQENLREFINLASQYENTKYKGFYNFVRYVDKTVAQGGNISTQTATDSDSVLVTTIHKSKGLEFPIVFVIGCANKFNDKDATNSLILDPVGGIGLVEKDFDRRIKYKTAEYKAISLLIKKASHAEQQRLLYVAMTRAKEKLILVGSESSLLKKLPLWERYRNGQKMSDYYIRDINNYLDYVAGSFDEKHWDFHVVDTLPEICEKAESTAEKKTLKETSEEVIYRLSYAYPYDGVVNIPSKMSVSEIKKMSMDEEAISLFEKPFEKKIPSFMKEDELLKGAARGTIYHKVMEVIPPETDDTEAFLASLVKDEVLSEKEACCVDIKKIDAFLKSPIGEMMRHAKRVWKEEAFTMSIDARSVFPEGKDEKIMVQGTIDCLIESEDGKLVLLDYKTDIYENPEEIASRYKKQLELYELAVFEAFGKMCDKKYLYLFFKDDIIEV